MASSDVEVCNLALARIGGRARIESLDEQSAEAEACRTVYETVVGTVFLAHPWRWATRTAALDYVGPSPDPAWLFEYYLPTDLVAALSIESPVPNIRADQRPPYARVGDRIRTDEQTPRLRYLARSDVSAWPATFTDLVAWRLAEELALALDTKADLARYAVERARIAEARAASRDMAEGQDRAAPDAEWIAARG